MKNYFTILNIEPAYSVNNSELKQLLIEAQKSSHPDNFVNLDEAKRLELLMKSSDINDAYQVLQDPVKRAEHLLGLKLGDELDSESLNHDMDFLMAQLDLRSELEEIEQAKDLDKLMSYAENVDTNFNQSVIAITESFDKNNLDEVKILIDRLKFWQKLQREIERIEDNLA